MNSNASVKIPFHLKRLDIQLIIIISILFSLAVGLFIWHVIEEETEKHLNIISPQSEVIAKNLATVSGDYLSTGEHSKLDKLLLGVAEHKGFVYISVTNPEGKIIREVITEEGQLKINKTANHSLIPPVNVLPVQTIGEKSIITWQPIMQTHLLGWVRVDCSLSYIDQRNRAIMVDNITDAVFMWIFMVIGTLMYFRKPIHDLVRAANFASELDTNKGKTIGLNSNYVELQKLNDALNTVSENLHNQDLKINQTLNDLETQKLALDQHSIISITDNKGIITYVNDQFTEISGYEESELLGATHSIVNSGYHSKSFFKDMWKTLSSGEVWKGKICNRKKDGTMYWVQTTIVPFLDINKKPYKYVSVRTDITRLKEYEHDLQQLAAFPQNNPGIVLKVSSSGNIMYLNPTAEKQRDKLKELGFSESSFFPDELVIMAQYCYRKNHGEKGIETTMGDQTWLWTFHPIEGEHTVHCYAVNITERKKTEKALLEQQAINIHSQKLQAIGTLAGGMAHDFNNILQAIISYTELIEMDVPEDSEVGENANQIIQASERARSVISQILAFSRNTEEEISSIQPKHIVKEAVTLLRATIPTTINLNTVIDCDDFIDANPTQIHQIIMNICVNASHAIGDNRGEIEIRLSSHCLKNEIHTVQGEIPPGSYVCLSIRDTGPGIPQVLIHRIFDPFFTTKGVADGSGMGLSVVHGIVSKLRGGIDVDTVLNQGTTFNIYLLANDVYPGACELSAAV